MEKQSTVMCLLLIFSRSFMKHALCHKCLEVRFHILPGAFVTRARRDRLRWPAGPPASSSIVLLYEDYKVYFHHGNTVSCRAVTKGICSTFPERQQGMFLLFRCLLHLRPSLLPLRFHTVMGFLAWEPAMYPMTWLFSFAAAVCLFPFIVHTTLLKILNIF